MSLDRSSVTVRLRNDPLAFKEPAVPETKPTSNRTGIVKPPTRAETTKRHLNFALAKQANQSHP